MHCIIWESSENKGEIHAFPEKCNRRLRNLQVHLMVRNRPI